MTLPAPRLGAGLAALCVAAALSGCAVVKPPSTVPPTGWPDPPSASAAPAPTTPAPATPGAAAPSAPEARTATHDGIVLPLPEGYLDATALVTDVPSSGPTRLVAYLRNPAQHGITVQTWAADAPTLAGFLDFYVTAIDADTVSSVANRRPVTMGGGEGAELTLRNRADGQLTSVFVTMRAPGTVVMVLAPAPDEARRQAVEQVATGLRFA